MRSLTCNQTKTLVRTAQQRAEQPEQVAWRVLTIAIEGADYICRGNRDAGMDRSALPCGRIMSQHAKRQTGHASFGQHGRGLVGRAIIDDNHLVGQTRAQNGVNLVQKCADGPGFIARGDYNADPVPGEFRAHARRRAGTGLPAAPHRAGL